MALEVAADVVVVAEVSDDYDYDDDEQVPPFEIGQPINDSDHLSYLEWVAVKILPWVYVLTE